MRCGCAKNDPVTVCAGTGTSPKPCKLPRPRNPNWQSDAEQLSICGRWWPSSVLRGSHCVTLFHFRPDKGAGVEERRERRAEWKSYLQGRGSNRLVVTCGLDLDCQSQKVNTCDESLAPSLRPVPRSNLIRPQHHVAFTRCSPHVMVCPGNDLALQWKLRGLGIQLSRCNRNGTSADE